MKRKILSILLATCLTEGLVGCGGGNSVSVSVTEEASVSTETPASTEEAKELDLSERVDLVFYVMGEAPQDEELVEDEINKILLDKFNATVDMQFSTWTEFQQKYTQELTSQGADLIYIANWLSFGQLAQSGAFVALDDLLNTVGTEVRDLVGTDALNMCSVNGSVYAVPNTWAEYTSKGIKYREDLRKKYDLPVPNSLENMEAYFDGIIANDPDQGILTVTTEESTGLLTAFDAAWVLNIKYPWVTANGLPYGLAANYETPSDVYDYWFSDDFVDDMKMLKRWADKGYWSRSALSDTNKSDAYKTGLCVAEVAGQNPNKQITAIQELEEGGEGWESEYVAYGEVTKAIFPGHATQNGTAIVNGCKNPERAMLVLQAFLCDEELNHLISYGIKGTHYDVVDGIYENLSDTFPYEGFNTWNLRNGDTKLPQKTDVKLQEMFDKYDAIAKTTKFPNVNIYDGFAENYEDYTAERQAVSNVMRTYLAPLQAGLVDDVDAAVEEFRTKVKEAGLDTCREGFERQWAAYCDAYGYK